MKISFELVKNGNLANSTVDSFWSTLNEFKSYCLDVAFKQFCDDETKSITIEEVESDIINYGKNISHNLKDDGLILFQEFLENVATEIIFLYPINLAESMWSQMPSENEYGDELSEVDVEQMFDNAVICDYFESLHSLFNFYDAVRNLYSSGVQIQD